MPFEAMIRVIPALLGAMPVAAPAETVRKAGLCMFRDAFIARAHAGDAALTAHPGVLASVGDHGAAWSVRIDAKSGEAFALVLSCVDGAKRRLRPIRCRPYSVPAARG